MIVIRFVMVLVLFAIVSLTLAWLVTRNAKYLSYLKRVLFFAIILGLIAGAFYIIERVVLRA